MFIRNTLPLLRIPRVQFILPLARLEGILLGMHFRLRLMMESLTKPVGTAARSLGRRRKRHQQRRENNQNPRAIPHNQPPSGDTALMAQAKAGPTRIT